MKKQNYHFTARARRGLYPLRERNAALHLWNQLRAEFEDQTLACLLMPNHLHAAIRTATPHEARRRIGVLLRSFTRRQEPGRSLWSRQPPVPLPVTGDKLERLIRYIHLNPCRASLTTDPWSWEFSTIRDHSGETLEPWVGQKLLEGTLRRDARVWRSQHDAWVAQDSTVRPGILECRLLKPGFDQLSLEQLRSAVLALNRCEDSKLNRRGSARDLLVHALVSQSTCGRTWIDIATAHAVCRKRVGQLGAQPLCEKSKFVIRAHADLIHDSQRGRNTQNPNRPPRFAQEIQVLR